jgi:hypothetical protein
MAVDLTSSNFSVLVDIDELTQNIEVLRAIEKGNRDTLLSFDSVMFKKNMATWAAKGFPDTAAVHDFPLQKPRMHGSLYMCSDGVDRLLWEYIEYLVGTPISHYMSKFQVQVNGIILTYSIREDPLVLTLHAAKGNWQAPTQAPIASIITQTIPLIDIDESISSMFTLSTLSTTASFSSNFLSPYDRQLIRFSTLVQTSTANGLTVTPMSINTVNQISSMMGLSTLSTVMNIPTVSPYDRAVNELSTLQGYSTVGVHKLSTSTRRSAFPYPFQNAIPVPSIFAQPN